MITELDKQFMREAIRLANESVNRGGGPFGAVIVKDGKVIAGSSNSVTIDNDPTAHAEVNTIREACRRLGTFDLSGDARDIQFADDFIYEELERPLGNRTVPIIPLLRDEALVTFRLWSEKTDKTEY